jgi:hypothetical protein
VYHGFDIIVLSGMDLCGLGYRKRLGIVGGVVRSGELIIRGFGASGDSEHQGSTATRR